MGKATTKTLQKKRRGLARKKCEIYKILKNRDLLKNQGYVLYFDSHFGDVFGESVFKSKKNKRDFALIT